MAKLGIRKKDTAEAELGYMYFPEFLGKESVKRLIEPGIKSKELQKIAAFINPTNIPSRKTLESNGFVSIQVNVNKKPL